LTKIFQNIFLSVESDCFDERNGFGQFSESLVGEFFSKIPCGPPFVHPMLACGSPFVHPMLACGPPFVHPICLPVVLLLTKIF
jgi:hypothetical protein